MTSTRTHRTVSATPDEVWAILSDWAKVGDWFPGIADCVVDGETRTLTLGNGATIVETITQVDPELRRLEYEVTGGDIQVDAHRATLDVLDVGGSTVVVSSVYAAPASRLKIFAGTLEPALDGLEKVLGRS
ncbi:SRPBCC family protein [Nocardioides marmoriginsengisoli]|uniref:SRPBCC family protein n=1 Tax=Nocardioides marmoriginsengisoli TaxID=661483 RepID=A0A3N0CGA0_9ACTN|nr:SRPBCC family protein [Nocardioides marmoriginsengisoli]RNL62467.1 SRPBCC family protein [Nocardioides marmoriginsengisoli]